MRTKLLSLATSHTHHSKWLDSHYQRRPWDPLMAIQDPECWHTTKTTFPWERKTSIKYHKDAPQSATTQHRESAHTEDLPSSQLWSAKVKQCSLNYAQVPRICLGTPNKCLSIIWDALCYQQKKNIYIYIKSSFQTEPHGTYSSTSNKNLCNLCLL